MLNPSWLMEVYQQRSVQFSSVAQSCPTLCDSMNHTAHQASLPITSSRSSLKLMPIESVMPSSHLILCRPLLLPPSIFPSIRVFSNESALHIRWPKYWSFSFNISPSSEHPGLISFRMDWLDFIVYMFIKSSHRSQIYTIFNQHYVSIKLREKGFFCLLFSSFPQPFAFYI